MNWIVAVLFVGLGLFLSWQGLGFYRVFSWCHQITLPAFDDNLFLAATGAIVGKYAVILGIISIVFGAIYVIDRKNNTKNALNTASYMTMLIFMFLFTIASVL